MSFNITKQKIFKLKNYISQSPDTSNLLLIVEPIGTRKQKQLPIEFSFKLYQSVAEIDNPFQRLVKGIDKSIHLAAIQLCCKMQNTCSCKKFNSLKSKFEQTADDGAN